MRIEDLVKKVGALPLREDDDWLFERRPFDIDISEMGEGVIPHLLIALSVADGTIPGSTVVAPDAADSEVISWALKCLLNPMIGEPHRPGSVSVFGEGMDALRSTLEQVGIRVTVCSEPDPVVTNILTDMLEDMTSPGQPPYTVTRGVSPEMVGNFFEAAREYYRVKPWKLFHAEIPIRLEWRLKKKETVWGIVMGSMGEQFGLSTYRSAHGLMAMLDAESDIEAQAIAMQTPSIAFSYESLNEIGRPARNEIELFEWPLENPDAYPSVMVISPRGNEPVRSPKKDELITLTIATKALAKFFSIHPREVGREEEITDTVDVEIGGERVEVLVEFPAPEFMEDQLEIINPAGGLTLDEYNAREVALASLQRAFEEENPEKRVQLARKALDASPYCSKAYILLAQEAARDEDEQMTLARKALDSARHVMGENAFEAMKGDFWETPESQDYMNALNMLTQLRLRKDDCEGAIPYCREMLELNPRDHQGARHILLACLVLTGKDEEAADLIALYPKDKSAMWYYGKALLKYRRSGPSKQTDKSLAKALQANPHVVDYVLQRRSLPTHRPSASTPGSEEEAALFSRLLTAMWRLTEGARDWLREQVS